MAPAPTDEPEEAAVTEPEESDDDEVLEAEVEAEVLE